MGNDFEKMYLPSSPRAQIIYFHWSTFWRKVPAPDITPGSKRSDWFTREINYSFPEHVMMNMQSPPESIKREYPVVKMSGMSIW